jgi:hypothetical protein
MTKPTTIIDKNWLQLICERPDIADSTFDSLKQKCQPVVALVLIEEILANRFQTALDQVTVGRMIQAVLDFHPHWMEHPAELVFKELVKNEPISNVWLSQEIANRAHEGLSNPETASPSLAKWATDRYEEKKQRLPARKKQQEKIHGLFQKIAAAFLCPPDLATFAKNGSSFLAMVLNQPGWRQFVLEAYLGQTWKRWHSAETADIDAAFSRLDNELLLELPFTRNYLLAELLYDVGPITKVGPPESEKSNPQVLSGNQINNEEDQEYVASAFHCDRLLTCDRGMQRIAESFRQAGYWKGNCVFIPRNEADQLDRHFV